MLKTNTKEKRCLGKSFRTSRILVVTRWYICGKYLVGYTRTCNSNKLKLRSALFFHLRFQCTMASVKSTVYSRQCPVSNFLLWSDLIVSAL